MPHRSPLRRSTWHYQPIIFLARSIDLCDTSDVSDLPHKPQSNDKPDKENTAELFPAVYQQLRRVRKVLPEIIENFELW